MTELIVVLDDGETYSYIDGCKILEVPSGIEGDDIDAAVREDELRVVAELTPAQFEEDR